MITSNLYNFPSRGVWITSSVSIVYEQPSYYLPLVDTNYDIILCYNLTTFIVIVIADRLTYI